MVPRGLVASKSARIYLLDCRLTDNLKSHRTRGEVHILSGHGVEQLMTCAKKGHFVRQSETQGKCICIHRMKAETGSMNTPYGLGEQPLLFTMSPLPSEGPLLLLFVMPPPQLLFVMSLRSFRPAERLHNHSLGQRST